MFFTYDFNRLLKISHWFEFSPWRFIQRILIVLSIILAAKTYGMEMPFRQYLGSHGLASREVISLCNDMHRGLWIGTSSGLNLMNADGIVGFSSPDGLPSSTIGSLCVDTTGNLWIGTDGGIVIRDTTGFHVIGDSLSLAGLDFRRLVPLTNGDVVACTRTRIFRCNERGVDELIVQPPLDLNDELIAAAAHTDSCLLIGTEHIGLSLIDLYSGIRTTVEPLGERNPEVFAIYPDSILGILVITGGRLAVYDTDTNSLSPVPFAETVGERLIDCVVTEDGTIWSISYAHLWRISPESVISYNVPAHPFTMTAVHVDHEGSIWIATSGDGLLQYYNTHIENLSHETLISPLSFYFETNDSIYVTTDRNVLLHDRAKGTTLEIVPADTSLFTGEIWDMARMDDKLIIVGQQGLFEINDTNMIVEPEELNRFTDRFIVCIEKIGNDLLLGTASGVIRYSGDRWSQMPGIPETVIYYLAVLNGQSIYACTSGLGIWIFDDDTFIRHPVSEMLPSMGINCLVADSTGDGIWIGSEDGLHYYDSGGTLRSWNEGDGLCNTMVTGLAFDGQNRLWIGTDKGVQLFFPNGETFGPVYDSRVGLIGDEITTGRALTLDGDGGLWCGYFGGVSYIDVSSIQGFEPGPAIDMLRITYGDRSIRTGVHLPYGNAALRIGFRERSLKWPQQTVFRYRLSGVDDEWVITRRNEEIRYRFLPSGSHTFEISARHQLSEWGPFERFSISVEKPFWETIPFITGVSLFIILTIWGVVALRTYRLKLRQAELEELVAIRTGQLEDALDTVRELSLTDELTGLPNRRALKEQLSGVLERARRAQSPISLLVIDIDRFKSLNDNWGHASGDSALIHMADAMRRQSRKSDIVCRWGGDEFIYVLHGAGRDEAHAFAEKLRERIEISVFRDTEGNEFTFTVSIGVVCMQPEETNEWEDLISRADMAMYEAKERGKNRVVMDTV